MKPVTIDNKSRTVFLSGGAMAAEELYDKIQLGLLLTVLSVTRVAMNY